MKRVIRSRRGIAWSDYQIRFCPMLLARLPIEGTVSVVRPTMPISRQLIRLAPQISRRLIK